MASELRVDKIIPTSGVATNGSGGLVQTRFTQIRRDSASTTSTSFIDTGVHCSITPKFSTSKIMISISHYFWFQSDNESDYCVATIYRDSTNLGDGNLGSNATSGTNSSSGNSMQWYTAQSPIASYNNGFSFEFVDQAHNSTSELTYKLYMRCNTSGSQLWYGWPGQVSTMRLQELSA
tara:strand:- start:39 stop:572 length:534 start_codon:yes stop_codon:yes gene_type:complete